MQARAPLMIEHRLIDRMIAVLNGEIPRMRSEKTVRPEFIDTALDFICTYIDRTHHGKEEEIMFKTLADKPLSEHDRRLMEELIGEHAYARRIAGEITRARDRQRSGDFGAVSDIANGFAALADFYPKHIEKEDRDFFPNSRAYLSDEEDHAMLAAFREFDRELVQEIYRERVEALERSPESTGVEAYRAE